MQKKLLLIGITLCLLMAYSCQKDPLYSCDPQIEAWAQSNLNDIQKMSRAGFVELDNVHIQRGLSGAATR